jgi:hypothetical protein
MKYLILFFIPTLSFGFTLNNSIGARFKSEKVQVRAGLNSCNNVDMQEVAGLINDAIKNFWNTVPTSRLDLQDGGSFTITDNTFYTGELCLTGGACGGAPVPAVNDIVITCNENTTNFPGGSSLLALTLPNSISGKNILGSVILINDNANNFDNLSTNQKISVIAHEIGHAIGLGHSDDRAALMFFSVVPVRSSLGQDDIDGVTYLYPVQFDLFGAGCFLGSINKDDDWTFWPTALLGMLLALVFFKRSKRTS